MKVLEVKQIYLPDNDDRPPGEPKIPMLTFDATVSPEGHAEIMQMIAEAQSDQD